MKIFILGGTGFIGYYSTIEALKRGHQVTSISLPDIEIGSWCPMNVEIKYGNIFNMDENELKQLLSGYDALVYALGPDDRINPKGSAYEFFHERLVNVCSRVISMAREAGVTRCVVLNSYFAYFDRINPERKLSQRHPYIKCRIEQASRAFSEGKDKMDVMVLELPYIFGSMPQRIPLWKDVLVDMLYKSKVILYPKGGSNMIAVENVAEAVVGALEKGRDGIRYTIGDENVSWIDMIQIMLNSMSMNKKKIISLSPLFFSILGIIIKKKNDIKGIEAGLNPKFIFNDIMCKEFYYDPSESANELGYNRGNVKQSIDKTIKACIPYLKE